MTCIFCNAELGFGLVHWCPPAPKQTQLHRWVIRVRRLRVIAALARGRQDAVRFDHTGVGK